MGPPTDNKSTFYFPSLLFVFNSHCWTIYINIYYKNMHRYSFKKECFFYNQQMRTERWIMPWIRIASEYTKIYEAWLLSTDNAHGRKHCFNIIYWDHIPTIRIRMKTIMSVYTTRKNLFLPKKKKKAKTKIIWNLCSKRNIYKAAIYRGQLNMFYVLYSTWEDMGFVVKPGRQCRL